MKNEIIEWVKSIGIALILGIIINSFIGGTRVLGVSMNPTLIQDDVLVLYNSKKVSRGDIILIKTDLAIAPEELEGLNAIAKWKIGKTKTLIKRVIAVEGDSIIIEDGKVFLNGQELEENYVDGKETPGDIKIEKIPKDKIFVMGDNRYNSLDSRSRMVGLVDVEDVKGKIIMRLYPFSKFGTVR